MSSQVGTEASLSGGEQLWEGLSLEGSEVVTTFRASTTADEYREKTKDDEGTANEFTVASIPNDLKRPYNETKTGITAFPYPSSTLLGRGYLDHQKAEAGHNKKSKYYASKNSRLLRPLNQTCVELASRLRSKAKNQIERSFMLPGGPGVVVHEHLYDKKREKVMTYSLELRLVANESDSLTQASTISPVQAKNEQDTEADGSDDAVRETDDKYPPGDETDTDAESASDEEIYLQ